MKKQILKNVFPILLIAMLLFQSCTRDNIEQETSNFEQQEYTLRMTPVVEKLVEMGYNAENIVEFNDFYVVDGDLTFSKDINDYSELSNNQRTHYRANTLVSDSNITIKVFSNISEPDGIPSGTSWNLAVNQAISDWNAIRNGCSDLFEITTNQSTADIVLSGPDNMVGGWPGGASHILGWVGGNPSCGEPFPEVLINTNFLYSDGSFPTQINMQNIVGHELGHAIGFRHTDGNEGLSIPGTSGADPNSIMHGNIIFRQGLGLSGDDITAAQYLYGCNSTINDNQNAASTIAVTTITPDPFCYIDTFSVSGTFNNCTNNNAIVNLCFSNAGGTLSFPQCIASGYFTNGTFSFTNLSLSSIPNFNPNNPYNVTAKITGPNGATSNSVSVPFVTDCMVDCPTVNLDQLVVSYSFFGLGSNYTQSLITWPDNYNGNYILEFTSSDACDYGPVSNVGETVTYIQSENSFNLLQAIADLGNKCVEVSIRPDCATDGDACLFRIKSSGDPINSPFIIFEGCNVLYTL